MKAALLTNFIPPYRLPLYRALAAQVGELRVFVSTAMERNRAWVPEWGGLDVIEQRTLTLRRTWRTSEFSEPSEVHIPYDTVVQLARWAPHVIVTAEMGARSLQAVAYARTCGTPVVLWATLSAELEKGRGAARRALRRWLLPRADGVIVNGEEGARYVQSFGVDDGRILRVPYTADVAPFAELPLFRPRGDDRRLLYVGALSRRKGVELLVEGVTAWAELNPERAVLLTMVGDGPLAEPLRRRSTPPNLRIVWEGNVLPRDLPSYFGAADIFVFPTLGDEWGVVVNEALAAGLPVLGSTRSQAVIELVVERRNGWRFAPDAVGTTAALERALSVGSDELAEMRRAARDTGLQLGPERMAERIAERLRQLCSR